MINKLFLKIILFLISIYKALVSPLLPNSCRFYPSCSNYTKDSLIEHGIFRGIWYGLKRIAKCHPLCSGGYDPVVKKTAEH